MNSAELARKLSAWSVSIRSGGRGGGSGVICSADGRIVTNAHVVRSRDPLVTLSDGREFRASLIRVDRRSDLALLQISAHGLPAAEFADSDSLRAGQLVLAIGNPLGVIGAVTAGVIHALSGGRWIEASVRLAPGNSGGLLADAEGRVIGINTMIQSGVALAIPGNTVRAFIDEAGSRRAHAA